MYKSKTLTLFVIAIMSLSAISLIAVESKKPVEINPLCIDEDGNMFHCPPEEEPTPPLEEIPILDLGFFKFYLLAF